MPKVGEPYNHSNHQEFTAIDDELARSPLLNLTEKVILSKLRRLGNRYGKIFPSTEYLGREWCLDKRTIERALEGLEEKGFIRRERRNHAPSKFFVLWHESFESHQGHQSQSENTGKAKRQECPSQTTKSTFDGARISISEYTNTEDTKAHAQNPCVAAEPLPPKKTDFRKAEPPACYNEADLENFRIGVTAAAQASGRGDLGRCPRDAAIDALREGKSYPVDALIQAVRREFCSRLDPRRPQNMRSWWLLRIIVNQILRREPEYDGPPQPKPPERADQASPMHIRHAQFERWRESKGITEANIRASADFLTVWDQFELECPMAQRAAA